MKTEEAYQKVHALLNGEDNTFHLFKIVVEIHGEEFTSRPMGYSQTLEALKRGRYPDLLRVEHKYLLETTYTPL